MKEKLLKKAEHHDGFQMYDSIFSKWNAANMGPRRDIIGELAAAVREKGLICRYKSYSLYKSGYPFYC